jgi:altered-inheritance-of-mitochondria protein 5
MGFIAGFVCPQLNQMAIFQESNYIDKFGGFTLTASVLYLSVQVHRSTRLAQRDAIREQVEILNNISSPLGAYYRRFAQDDDSQKAPITPPAKKPSAEELLKQQWNKEVEALAKKTVTLRWQDVTNTATEVARVITDLVKRQ